VNLILSLPAAPTGIIEFMYKIETEQEADGRWIAEVPELEGVLVYAESRDDAIRKAQALSLRVLAERLEHREDL
jgi:predicted RNase H-like HicB family nuclease